MSGAERRVLVLAPIGRDGRLLSEAIQRSGMETECCASPEELLRESAGHVGAILVTEEAATPEVAAGLREIVASQPAWSDLPILLLTGAKPKPSAASLRMDELWGSRGNVTLLERPIRVDTLVSTVKTALRSRRRQYQMRDYLIERQRDEEQLRETQKLESIGLLAGGIAHDFNNLLTGIIGNASLCLEMAAGDRAQEERLQDLIVAGQRAAELTSQLLAYAGKGHLVLRPVNLSGLVSDIVPLIKSFIAQASELTLDLNEQLPGIEGDRAQLQQVIMNLIINAAEAMPENRPGTICVRTGVRRLAEDDRDRFFMTAEVAPGDYAFLDVSDTGSGMPEEVRARIFDPFFTTKFQGRGLGLAAVMGIVRRHKGILRVFSEPDRGTAFSVFFPVAGEAPRAAEPVETAPHGDLTGTVLFVDDEPTVSSFAVSALARHGMKVHLARNGVEAIDIFRRFAGEISLVILDMTMPILGGEQAYAELRQISPEIKVVLSSGFSEAMLLERFAGKGLAGFLHKPFTVNELLDKVQSVLKPSA